MSASDPTCTGFTLVELVMTVAIVAVLSAVAFPMAEVAIQRNKEQLLRTALREIREALDAYRAASDDGHIPRRIGESGYPRSLTVLVEGVVDATDPAGGKLKFLRKIPRDPLFPDRDAPPEKTWGKRSYNSSHDKPEEGDDVFDVYSRAEGIGLDGIAYREW